MRPRLGEAWSAFPLTLADAAGCGGGGFSEPALAAIMVCGVPEDAENDDRSVVLEPTPTDAEEEELEAEGGDDVAVAAIFAVLETTATNAVEEAELAAAGGGGDAAAAILARNR